MDYGTHVIKVVYNGTAVSLHFWTGGNGRHVQGYYTSLSQLRRKLCRTFKVRELDLYCIVERRLRPITSERYLRRVLGTLRDGGVLFINAFKRGSVEKEQHFTHPHTHHQHHNQHYYSDSDERDIDVHVHFWHEEDEDKNAMTFPAPDNFVKDGTVSDVIARFVVHNHTCYHCEKTSIRGVRYTYKKNERYSLCGTCYHKLNRTERISWTEHFLPWSYTAPAGPLQYGKEGEGVIQLQYILTCLGYMRLSDTSIAVGVYGERTEAAIKKFRSKNGVHGGSSRTYDYNTACHLASVIRRLRRLGHWYL